MKKTKRSLPFQAKRPVSKLMPDPRAGEVVAKASLEVPDPSFDVVLRRGHEIKHIFFRFEPSEQVWAGVIGITVPVAGAEQLHQQLNDQVEAAVTEGWAVRADNRR